AQPLRELQFRMSVDRGHYFATASACFCFSKKSTIASTSAGTVYAAGMIVVWMLHCVAASAVTGPIDATMVVRSRSAAGSAPGTLTKLRTADALVHVTTSMRRSRSI